MTPDSLIMCKSFSRQNIVRVIGLAIIGSPLIAVCASNYQPELTVRPFDSRIWKQCLPSRDSQLKKAGIWNQSLSSRDRQRERQGMLKDLVINHKLVGLSEQELVALLGPSEESEPECTYQGKGADGKGKWRDWQYVYDLGFCGHDSIRLLLIRIEHSKVTDYHVVDQDSTSYENTDKYVDPGLNPKGSPTL